MEAISKSIDALSSEAAFDYAKRALPLMARYGVKPTPKNYAVWYVFIADSHNELVHEINNLINERMAFSDDINDYLYTKYIAGSNDQIIQQAAQGAHRILAEIYAAVSQFTGDTKDCHQNLFDQMKVLGSTESDSELKEMAQKIIESVAALKDSGGALTGQLESSQQEIDALRENLAKVTIESEKDFLTGVYNRKALDRKLEEMIARSKHTKTPLCLIMADVDHFKAFNDKYGHLIGDEVLKIVAKALTDTVKGQDVVARYGGEEFSVILPDTPIGGGMIVAEAIRKAIATKELKRKDTGETFGQVTVSLGVSMYRHETDTLPVFLKRADEALYRSKKSGRNCVTQEILKNEESR